MIISINMKVYFDTFGCTSNQSTSEHILWILKSVGFEIISVNEINEMEIYICNTCIVKNTTEQKIMHKIR